MSLHSLDVLTIRNAIKHLQQASDYLKEGGFKAELMASLDVAWAITDLESMLKNERVNQ